MESESESSWCEFISDTHADYMRAFIEAEESRAAAVVAQFLKDR
jgi:hypothetical protein